MMELPDEWLLILQAIRNGPVAWRGPRELAGELGQPAEAALDAMAEMHLAGWLDVWERDDGLVVTLSPRAAARLGTHLVEARRPDSPRWSRPGEPRRENLRSERLGEVAAEAIDPLDVRSIDGGASEPGQGPPTLLVGVGLCPWPGPRQARSPDPCPACRGSRLGSGAYCLRCDRWGRVEDGLSVLRTRPVRPQPLASPAGIEARASAERARRRARRKALLKALAGSKPRRGT